MMENSDWFPFRIFLWIGLVLQGCWVVFLSVYRLALHFALNSMSVEETRSLAAFQLAADWSQIGFALGFLGAILMAYSVIRGRLRDKWIFWTGIALGLFWLAIPQGYSIIGITIVAMFLLLRKRFFANPCNPDMIS